MGRGLNEHQFKLKQVNELRLWMKVTKLREACEMITSLQTTFKIYTEHD